MLVVAGTIANKISTCGRKEENCWETYSSRIAHPFRWQIFCDMTAFGLLLKEPPEPGAMPFPRINVAGESIRVVISLELNSRKAVIYFKLLKRATFKIMKKTLSKNFLFHLIFWLKISTPADLWPLLLDMCSIRILIHLSERSSTISSAYFL